MKLSQESITEGRKLYLNNNKNVKIIIKNLKKKKKGTLKNLPM